MTSQRVHELSTKREVTRKRIFDATFRLLGHEHGLATRIEEICAEAKISRGTFYNYFSSTDELFSSLAKELSHDFNVAVISALSSLDDSAACANTAMQHYLKRAQRDQAWGWAMVHLSAMGPIFGEETYGSCCRTMEQAIATGQFDIPDARYGTVILMGSVLAAMVVMLREGGSRIQPHLVSERVLRALGVSEREARRIATGPLPRISQPD